ncbi:MAG: hypothetical protein JSV50_21785 [Desulfobacteraceae bacterium]|nr:MAG: hypothetical protein JSV50_21785 [Desulfobacteraceae bacterium]
MKPKENTREDAEAQDRKRAYHLGMTLTDYLKRKAELLRQAEGLKAMKTE